MTYAEVLDRLADLNMRRVTLAVAGFVDGQPAPLVATTGLLRRVELDDFLPSEAREALRGVFGTPVEAFQVDSGGEGVLPYFLLSDLAFDTAHVDGAELVIVAAGVCIAIREDA